MAVAVICYLVAGCLHPAQFLLEGIDAVSYYKEGAPSIILFHTVHNPVSHRGIRSVVKGKGNHGSGRIQKTAIAHHHPVCLTGCFSLSSISFLAASLCLSPIPCLSCASRLTALCLQRISCLAAAFCLGSVFWLTAFCGLCTFHPRPHWLSLLF